MIENWISIFSFDNEFYELNNGFAEMFRFHSSIVTFANWTPEKNDKAELIILRDVGSIEI
jgi:hypothetical protein